VGRAVKSDPGEERGALVRAKTRCKIDNRTRRNLRATSPRAAFYERKRPRDNKDINRCAQTVRFERGKSKKVQFKACGSDENAGLLSRRGSVVRHGMGGEEEAHSRAAA